VLLFLLACTGSKDGGAATAGGALVEPLGYRPDIVLVTLDTTRADRLGAYGYAQAKTDTIDALAAKGIRFDQAISPLPLTIPSHATMFTGLHPYHHGVRANGDNVLAREYVTLAERLKDAGYVTAASVAAFVTTRQWGLAQGFDAYFDSLPEEEPAEGAPPAMGHNAWHDERSGDLVVDDALNWLASQPVDKPVFLWVHLYDAHFPYVPRDPYTEAFKDRPYDGELAFVDDQVGRLVEAFEGRKVLWSLIGDHGESLGEHGETTHGLYAYQATQHIPWILSGAGVKPGVVTEPVASADLMPTLLRIVGLPVPEDVDGRPQPGTATVPYAESYQLSDRFRIAPHRVVVDGSLKLIDTPRPELYDLVADPRETTDLAATRPDDVKRLQGLLAAKNATPPSKERAVLDAETVGQLAALGYVSGDVADVDYATLPDPKDFKEFIAKVNRVDLVQRQKGPSGALELLDELIAQKPDAFELRMRKLPLLVRTERAAEVKPFMEETAALFPDRSRVWVVMAGMALKEGDTARALELARRGLQSDPSDPAAQESEVECLMRLEKFEEAEKIGLAHMEKNPANYGVAALLGRYYLSKRNLEGAEKFLRIAVTGPNPRRAARSQLAMLAVAAGARQDAYTLLEAEVKDYPGNQLARRMLSRMYAEDGRWLDQKGHAEFLARARPKEAGPQLAVAQCLFNLSDFAGARKALDAALALAANDPDVLLLHANLLAKEGKRDEGLAVFQRARALNDARVAEAQKKGAKVVVNPNYKEPSLEVEAPSAPPAAPPAPASGGR